MNIVDSSGWLEYYADGSRASDFEKPLKDVKNLLVPTVCIYEVFKVVLRERGEDEALRAAAGMMQGKILDLTVNIAMEAARISCEHKIPMADSIILATGRALEATIWTMDKDFERFAGVKYFPET